jgi:hypothetical protein
MGPIDDALTGGHNWIHIKSNQLLRSSLQDFHTIIKIIGQQPNFCRELVPDTPKYIGYCDASKLWAGGVWMSGSKFLKPQSGAWSFPKTYETKWYLSQTQKGT